VTVALLLALVGPARADDWFGRDKDLHAAASAVIAAGSYGAVTPWIEAPAGRAAVAASVAISVGAAKEAWDAAGHGDPSWKDFAWDVAGTIVGVGVALLIDHAAG
jgi:putative lipoprotein